MHRHIYGKWARRCCQCLKQEPAELRIVDGGIPAAGLVAHMMIGHYVDHLPYYRLEAIAARSGVHTPRSTLAQWSGRGGAALEPLYELHKTFVLSVRVLHADETPVAMLDPGAGKTKRAYVWAYARGAFDETGCHLRVLHRPRRTVPDRVPGRQCPGRPAKLARNARAR